MISLFFGFFFLSNVSIILFIANFFSLVRFLNSLVINSRVLWVTSFKNLTTFRMFFLFWLHLSKLSFFFSCLSFIIYSIGDCVNFFLFVFCFMWNFLLVLKMTWLSEGFLLIVFYWIFLGNSLN